MSECSTRNTRSHPSCPTCGTNACCTGCGGSYPANWSGAFPCGFTWPWSAMQDGSSCSRYMQPICASAAQYANADAANGATLVIHKIVLEPCGNQSCTPRTFRIRVTGPSYPCGEIFTLTAGNCLTLDEPLVITGLEPGTYCVEEIFSCPNEYITTYTGPVFGRCVSVTSSRFPTVITICNRRRLCRLCHGHGCGCSACSICR